MKNDFDYQDLVDELKDEIGAGSLTKEEMIQVLRSDESVDGYTPIIDWYYSDDVMTEELASDPSDTKEEKEDKKLILDQYNKDKQKLESISVDACLQEMFEKSN